MARRGAAWRGSAGRGRDFLIYLVSGDGARCGTSMLCAALEAGGMDVLYDPAEDLEGQGDYHPNPLGHYTLSKEKLFAPGFPDESCEGKVIKMTPFPWTKLGGSLFGWPDVTNVDFEVVWLTRSPQARWASYEKAFSGSELAEDNHDAETCRMLRDIAGRLVKDHLRVVVPFMEIPFDTIIENPAVLERIPWPFDWRKAAQVVNPDLRRFS